MFLIHCSMKMKQESLDQLNDYVIFFRYMFSALTTSLLDSTIKHETFYFCFQSKCEIGSIYLEYVLIRTELCTLATKL